MTEFICEMAGCDNEMESIFGDFKVYGDLIKRDVVICEECWEEYTNMEAYGRSDYSRGWLLNSQDEILAIQ